MKVLICGDIHLKSRDHFGSLKDSNGIKVEERSVYKIKKMNEIIKKESPDVLIINGDLFDTKTPSEWMRALFFKKITPLVNKLYIISGNHDSFHKYPVGASESHGYSNLEMVHAQSAVKFGDFTLIGFTRDDAEFIDLCNTNKNDILITHREPKDFYLPFDFCFYSHIHMREEFFKNHHSIGSLFKDSWTEENFVHGYLIIDSDGGWEFKDIEDINIKTFDSIQDVEDGVYHAIRFKIKGKASEIYSINEKEIRNKYEKTKVFFDFEIQEDGSEESAETSEAINIVSDAFNHYIKENNCNEEQTKYLSELVGI